MPLPKKIREWWQYLDSLNEKLEHPKIINLEVRMHDMDPIEDLYKVSSGYNFFVYALTGFLEMRPLAVVGGEVMDRALVRASQIALEVSMDVPEADLIVSPMTLQQLIGPELASPSPIQFDHPLRLQENCTVRALFTPRTDEVSQLRVGIGLIGLHIPTNELERAKAKGARLGI